MPGDRFANYTETARSAISFGIREAKNTDHTLLEPSHLALGMVGVWELKPYSPFPQGGITLEKLREVVQSRFSLRKQLEVTTGLTLGYKTALIIAEGLARREGTKYVDSSQLWGGLVIEGQILPLLEQISPEALAFAQLPLVADVLREVRPRDINFISPQRRAFPKTF